jgi:hypothetical protein
MTAEQFPDNPERRSQHEETTAELEAARQDKLEGLRSAPETDTSAQRLEAAREVIKQQEQAPEPATGEQVAPPSSRPRFRLDHKLDYRTTMASVQRKLTPVSRSFSKLIHTPVVEKTSEALEQTVARPSVVAGATWTSLIVGGVFYLSARYYGFALSGSELLFSFLIGGVLGLVIEGLWRLIKRRRHK